jgi:hypothetical protein
MAMLLDGPPSTIDDLSARDSDLLSVAVSENIDLTVKLQLAAGDIATAVESILRSAQSCDRTILRRFPSLRHIAVTPQLKRWHIYTTLRLVYQDLYYSRLNDRYQARMKVYRAEESQALDDLRATGLGVVFDPLPQSLAPNIGTTSTADAGGVLYIATAFVNDRGEEGVLSVPVEADTADGTAAVVTIAALADNATGWNLYAGLSPDSLARQNVQTLDPLSSVTLAPARLAAGPKPGAGQQGNILLPVPHRILRG